jgi:broad specificity phosphatase PhoE
MGLVLLVRHGQASFGADDYDVLSDVGWEQSRLLGRYLAERGVVPDVLLRGDMRRHRETAEGLVEGGGWAVEAKADGGWNEFDHLGVVAAHPESATAGELDRRGFQRLFELATQRWTAGQDDADYAEPWPAFVARVCAALDRACASAGPGGTVVVVSSGGPIAAAGAGLVDPDGADSAALARAWSRLNAVCVNSGVTRLLVGSTGVRMLTFNEHAHLEGDRLTYR